MSIYVEDITAHRALADNLARHGALLDTAAAAIVTIDSANQATTRMFG